MFDFLFFVAITLLVWNLWKFERLNSRIAESVQQVPGPPCLPLIGNLHHFSSLRNGQEFMFKAMRKAARDYFGYGAYKIWASQLLSVILLNCDDARTMLVDRRNIGKSSIYEFIHWINDGLLVSTGAKWQRRRKLLAPSFHSNVLSRSLPSFNKHSNELVNTLDKYHGQTVEIIPIVTKTIVHVLCETIMGINIDKKTSEEIKPYPDAITEMGYLFIKRLHRPWLHPRFLFNLSGYGKRFQQLCDAANAFTDNVIRKRMDELKLASYESSEYGDARNSRKPLLDILIDNFIENKSGTLTYSDIREEVDTFMFAGHDTSTVATWATLLCLANYPECQEKVYEELKALGNEIGDYDSGDLAKMPYLTQCIKESLRLFPPVGAVSRMITDDLNFSKFTLLKSKRTECSVDIFNLHRNPLYWSEPDRFDPERFAPENSRERHAFSYVPFSAGPRNCIAQNFALMGLKVSIAKIVRNFTIEPVDTLDSVCLLMGLVLRCKNGVKLKFHRRPVQYN